MKIAILYSGALRTWNEVRENHENNLFTPDCDLFFYTDEEPENTKYKQYIQIPERYYDVPDGRYDSNKNPITNTANTLGMWHNMFIGWCLVPKGYDVYVKARCDSKLNKKIDFLYYDYSGNNIYIPVEGDFCGGVNDRFAFGNYDVMKKYFSIYIEHQNLFQQGLVFHTEYYLTENMKRKMLNIIRIPVTDSIIRGVPGKRNVA
jgi:hypothetical protein